MTLLSSLISSSNLGFSRYAILSEGDIKTTIPFTIATKRIKYLGISLPKETKGLYAENYETLMKAIKHDTNRRDTLCSWVGRINIVKTSILLKALCRFNTIHIKLSMIFSIELEQTFLQFVWKH